MPLTTVQGDRIAVYIEGRYEKFTNSAILSGYAQTAYAAHSAPADSLRGMESLRTVFRNTCHVSETFFYATVRVTSAFKGTGRKRA
jgi:hypothetical protein